jgi:integrase
MKFKGTAKYQVKTIFELSGMLQFGQSKHEAKQSAKADGARGPTEYAQTTGIHSYSTYRAYFKTCTEFLQYAVDVHGIKKANQLTQEHVHDFLLSKSNVKLASFRRYSAALTKFDAALSRLLDRPPQWTDTLKEFRASAPVALDGEQPARAYRNPSALVGQIDAGMRLVAELQWRAGLRVSEACTIKPNQLKGISNSHTEKSFGLLEIKGKGGKVRIVPVSIEIYSNLQNRLEQGPLLITPAAYRTCLRQAVHQTGQEYSGRSTHGLRWCYAQEQMDTLIRENVTYEVALTTVSRLMGHERASITCRYLRRG